MSGNLDGFDASQHDSPGDFDLIPAGVYTAIMVKSEFKDGKKPGSKYINTQWQIVEGEHAKRVFFHMFTWENENERSVNIGKGQWSDVCRSVGIELPNDTSDLHDKPLFVKLAIKSQKDYDDKNVAKSFTSLATPIDAAQPAASGGGGPSWTK